MVEVAKLLENRAALLEKVHYVIDIQSIFPSISLSNAKERLILLLHKHFDVYRIQ